MIAKPRSYLLSLVLAIVGVNLHAEPDAVAQLEKFINVHVAATPTKLGKVRVRIVKGEQGNTIRYVDFLLPFGSLRPELRKVAQELDWQSYEDVRVLVQIADPDASDKWRFAICRPLLETDEC